MRPRVETRSLELAPRLGKNPRGRGGEWQPALGQPTIDIEHAKPNAFHMERPDRAGERLAFGNDRLELCLRRIGAASSLEFRRSWIERS